MGSRDRASAAPRRPPVLAEWQVRLAKCGLKKKTSRIVDIARACHLSHRHFVTAFANTVGDTPYRWRLRYRILHAKRMLARPENGLAQIALECGFSDQSHFTNTFTRFVGLSPGQWRRMIRMRIDLHGAWLLAPLWTLVDGVAPIVDLAMR